MEEKALFHFLRTFCHKDCDRYTLIRILLDQKKIPYKVFKEGGRHIYIPPLCPQRGEEISICAHYDRVPGTPGANDNSVSIFILLQYIDYLQISLQSKRPLLQSRLNISILFTDNEEIYGEKNYTDQGAYQLGLFYNKKQIKRSFIVLDMCGIGNTIIWDKEGSKLLKAYPLIEKKILQISPLGGPYNPLFSDDLGFKLQGFNTLKLSILPLQELNNWKRNNFSNLPLSWANNHTLADQPKTIDPEAVKKILKLIKSL